MPAPKRQRKADKLLHHTMPARDVMVDYALGPFDRAARDMERKWGVERLPELVSVEMAQRFGAAMAHLNAMIDEGDPAKVADAANNCIRGYAAMDAEAEANGAPKANPEVWEYELDGLHFAIMADDCAWPAIKEKRPDLLLFTMREVACALKAYQLLEGGIAVLKEKFPDARVTDIRPHPKSLPKDFYENGGDALPFGEDE